MSAHTQGPWSAGEGGHGVWANVKGVERRIVSVSLSALAGDVSAEADEATKEERLANARLIAASPLLLDVAKEAFRISCRRSEVRGKWSDRDQRHHEAVRAALVAAAGEEAALAIAEDRE